MKKTTLAAAVVLILLAGYVYWSDRADDTERVQDRVFDVAREDITRVEILGREETAVVLERQDGELELVEPVHARVDTDEVRLLLDNLENMTFARALDVEPGEDLSAYGLDQPSLTLRFTTRGGVVDGVRFGKDTLTPSSQYAQRIEDPRVLIVAEYLSTNLGKDAWDLREKRVFDASASEGLPVERLEVDGPGRTIDLLRVDGRWMLTEPFGASADSGAVDSIVRRVEELEMLDLVEDGNDDGHGLDPPTLTASLWRQGERTPSIQIEIGAGRGIDRYARVPSRPQVFVVDGALVDELARAPEALVSRRLFSGDLADITDVSVRTRSPERARTEASKGAAALLSALGATRAVRAEPVRISSRPTYAITLSRGHGDERVHLDAAGTASCAAARGDEAVTLRLDDDACAKLVGAIEAFLGGE